MTLLFYAMSKMPAKPNTVPDWLALRVALTPNKPAYWRQLATGEWSSTNWGGVADKVHALSAHLVRLGLRSGDHVAIMMPTVQEWEFCHLAVLATGGVVVGLDAHDAPENIRHILQTVEPKALLVESSEQFDLLANLLPTAPAIIIAREATASQGIKSLQNLLAPLTEIDITLPTVKPSDLATIIFTSGSTGQPKGIAYTHSQICLAGEAILSRFPSINEDARFPCWLPLSNLFQRIINLCSIMRGTQSYFVESPRDIAKLLPEIRPEFFVGVPRFYEKLYTGIQSEIAKRPWILRKIVNLAWIIGNHFQEMQRGLRPQSLALKAAHYLAERLVLSHIRGMMGPNLKFMVSGSAPMPLWLLEKMHGLGWLIIEAYGVSECIVPIANNTLESYRFGSVGKPLSENEIKIAEDGELLVRGPGVFNGYLGETSRNEAFEEDGYFHTGDYAQLDTDGFLSLTGRKSEIFKTSTGRRIAPVPVEACIKQLPYIENVVLLGRNRPVPVALLTLQSEVPGESRYTPSLTSSFLQKIVADLEVACSSLPAYQRPAGALVIRSAFSISGGELTSNLKLKRNSIEEKFLANIDALYDALEHSTDHSHCLVQEVP
jgi:long-chain acyl-CoA synthetase